MSHVLITGGAGFIGSRLARALVVRGHRVRVLDSLEPQIHGPDPTTSPLFRALPTEVEFHHGSVTSREHVRAALESIDTVVHLAAETGTGQSMYAISRYTDVNIGGTALLLDVMANECPAIQRIVVASSRAVCGEGKYRCEVDGIVFPEYRTAEDLAAGQFGVRCPVCGVPATFEPTCEDTPVRPSSVYGVTKLAQEQLVLTVARSRGWGAVALRYQNVYGPGQSLTNPYTGILSIFSTRLRSGADIRVFEDGLESRDFVYIDDVVEVTTRAVERPGPWVETLNVGSGEATSVETVAQTLRTLLRSSSPVRVTGEYRVGDIRHNVADLARVRAALGFEPSVRIEEGLRRFVSWVLGEQLQPDRYEESLAEMRARGLFR